MPFSFAPKAAAALQRLESEPALPRIVLPVDPSRVRPEDAEALASLLEATAGVLRIQKALDFMRKSWPVKLESLVMEFDFTSDPPSIQFKTVPNWRMNSADHDAEMAAWVEEVASAWDFSNEHVSDFFCKHFGSRNPCFGVADVPVFVPPPEVVSWLENKRLELALPTSAGPVPSRPRV